MYAGVYFMYSLRREKVGTYMDKYEIDGFGYDWHGRDGGEAVTRYLLALKESGWKKLSLFKNDWEVLYVTEKNGEKRIESDGFLMLKESEYDELNWLELSHYVMRYNDCGVKYVEGKGVVYGNNH